MKPQIYFLTLGRIALLFGIAFFISWITETHHDFFGDVLQVDKNEQGVIIRQGYDWSARHYWFVAGSVIMFILSFVDIIVLLVSMLKKHYPNLF